MSILHICNTFFEWELAETTPPTLEDALTLNPICMQLQFLPTLYANPQDAVLVSSRPENPLTHPLYTPQESPPVGKIDCWGYSKLIQEWAQTRNIPYAMPPWDIVKMVNSKTFSFSRSPLPGARLLFKGDAISPKSPRMALKSCFGTAGRGLVASDSPRAQGFCEGEWSRGLPIIAEPWVKRDLDFSTQWVISNSGEIAYLGVTICKTTAQGAHQANIAGMEEPPYLEQQKAVALETLQEMANMGYYGPVGFDAMIYNGNELQPIVEINARKTMGLITLLAAQKSYPNKEIELAYITTNTPGPLPQSLAGRSFTRQVIISVK